MNDMTTGNPKTKILKFMVPVLLGNLFQNLYNIADTMIVGRFLGVDALAAVGATGAILFFVWGWIIGLANGFGVLISQAFGAKNERLIKHYVAMATILCAVFAISMTVYFLFINDSLLQLMNTPDNIYQDTKEYITVIYTGIAATFLYNMLASIARGFGDSKTPLYFLIMSSVLNIGLDFYFIAELSLGVKGAALATIISQAVSGVLCFIYVFRKYEIVRFNREEAKINLHTIKKLLMMGIPMALQFSITSIGTMIVQSSLNTLGAVHIAAYSAAMKVQGGFMQGYVALGAAIATYVGQNFGAGKLDRVKKGVKDTVLITAAVSIALMIICYLFGGTFVELFVADASGEIVEIGQQIFRISLWFYFFLGLIFIYRNALQGLGNGLIPMLGGVAELIARGLVIWLLFEPLQFVGICLSDPLAWVLALVPLIPYYYWYMKKVSC